MISFLLSYFHVEMSVFISVFQFEISYTQFIHFFFEQSDSPCLKNQKGIFIANCFTHFICFHDFIIVLVNDYYVFVLAEQADHYVSVAAEQVDHYAFVVEVQSDHCASVVAEQVDHCVFAFEAHSAPGAFAAVEQTDHCVSAAAEQVAAVYSVVHFVAVEHLASWKADPVFA